RTNAARAIENGLPADQALRAFTWSAAEILGVSDRLGSIEPGKIANLTITKGDLFDRSTRITNVFIDGRPIELRPQPPAPTTASGAPAPAIPSMAGTWTINVDVNGQNLPGTMTVRQEGTTLSGSIQTQLSTSEFSGGTLTGTSFNI